MAADNNRAGTGNPRPAETSRVRQTDFTTHAATGRILGRLEQVRQTGPDRWIARCPAHEDRSPSLSIREADGGRLLLHCFSGCAVQDVLRAAGLGYEDLFPLRDGTHYRSPVGRSLLTLREAVALLRESTTIVMFAAADIGASKQISDADRRAVIQAGTHIQRVLDGVGP
jgi:hypothetical protein